MIDPQKLLQDITGFPIDDTAAERTYSLRLMQENAWTKEFTARVVVEYKRFVFLSMVAGHHCVPSTFIDQAWHTHILYLHSYLFDFCHKVLGRMLWHTPSKGGRQEFDKHHALYFQTLDSYQRWFGETPPADIWGRCIAMRHHEGKTAGVVQPFTSEIAELVLENGK